MAASIAAASVAPITAGGVGVARRRSTDAARTVLLEGCRAGFGRSAFAVVQRVGLNAGTAGRSCGPHDGWKLNAWFKFGNNGLDSEGAGIYGSQGRDDFDRDDVEQYFNYMGMLATEGTYDKMEALLSTGTPPVDILLLLAASEGDVPKIEELLRAGADPRVKDDQGRTALDRAADEDIKNLIQSKSLIKV